MYTEDDLLPISALQHLLFCPRQCALIHIEQAWSENRLTAQGRQLHDRTHEAGPESRGDVRIARGLRLCSRQLGLTGQADVVELRRAEPDSPVSQQASVPGLEGVWTLHPVEYKRGRPKQNDCDRVQLCAQAMCLEEMLRVQIPEGSLFYGQPRRREPVELNAQLRERTRLASVEVRNMIRSGHTPPPEYSAKCRSCSLRHSCMPKQAGRSRRASLYIRRQLRQATETNSSGEAEYEET